MVYGQSLLVQNQPMNSHLELGHPVECGCPGGLPRVGVDAVEGEQRRRAAVQSLKHSGHLVHVTHLVHAVPIEVEYLVPRDEMNSAINSVNCLL